MARDFHIRLDLQQLGLPERTIRVLEKAALLVQLIEDQAALTSEVAAIDLAVDALAEENEDQNLSLTSLDARIDAFEVLAPFVRQDQTAAWADATGTLARTTFATFAGQTITNPPTQAEVEAIDDHLVIISQRLAALINDLRAISALT